MVVSRSKARQVATTSQPTFSAQQCKCGCGQLIPQRLVDLGRLYLRGHKMNTFLGPHKITKHDIAHQGRAPHAKVLSATNWEAIEKFVMADIEGRQARLQILTKELTGLNAKVDAMREEMQQLEDAINSRTDALSKLLPAKKDVAPNGSESPSEE